MGKREWRIRSRGLPSQRRMERKCCIMTKAIRKPLVVGGAGERPAKKLAHQPCVRFPIALPCGEPSPTLPTHAQKKVHAVSRSAGDCPRAFVEACVPDGDRTIVLWL